MRQIALLLILLMILPGCGDSKDKESDGKSTGAQSGDMAEFETPEAAFAAFQQAAVDEDMAAAMACFSPKSQEQLATLITIPLAFIAAFESDKKADIEKLLKKHGVSMGESDQFAVDAIDDKAAFVVDVIEWLEKNADSTEEGPVGLLAKGKLGKVTVNGDSAEAKVIVGSEQEDIKFVRIDGSWFLEMVFPENDSTVTFPDVDGGDFGDMGLGAGNNVPPPPVGMTKQEFDASWQVTLDIVNQPAGPALTELAEQLGLKLDSGAASAAMEELVSVQGTGISRFAAIEQMCEHLDVTPEYSWDSIRLQPGKRTLPVRYMGPFVVVIDELTTEAETATGQLSIQVYSAGLPATVVSQLNKGFGGPIKVQGVEGPSGTLLRDHSVGGGWTQNAAAVFDRDIYLRLRDLLRSVTAISQVNGSLTFELPTKVDVLAFNKIASGTEKKEGEVVVKLSKVEGTNFTFEHEKVESAAVTIIAFNAKDERVAPVSTSTFGSGGKGNISLMFSAPPTRFEAHIVSSSEPVTFEFTFKDLPLADHANMPEQLPELAIEGDSPISVEFVKLTGNERFRKIAFRVTNHTNKVVDSFSMKVQYLDPKGKFLKEFPSTRGTSGIPPGKEDQIEIAAFFLPDAAVSATATVNSVEFGDASEWKPEK